MSRADAASNDARNQPRDASDSQERARVRAERFEVAARKVPGPAHSSRWRGERDAGPCDNDGDCAASARGRRGKGKRYAEAPDDPDARGGDVQQPDEDG